jgi:hypothetical protein
LSTPVASFSKTIFNGLQLYTEHGCLIREMSGMKRVGVKHSTVAVAHKKRMEIRSAVAASGGDIKRA